MGDDGSADLQYVLAVAKSIGETMVKELVVVDKSTVPVGTADQVKATIQKELELRNSDLEFDVVSNPEFLKEGAAINDFMKPDRVVIGADSEAAFKKMREIYSPFFRSHDRFICQIQLKYLLILFCFLYFYPNESFWYQYLLFDDY